MMPPRERPPYERARGFGPRIARGGHEMEDPRQYRKPLPERDQRPAQYEEPTYP